MLYQSIMIIYYISIVLLLYTHKLYLLIKLNVVGLSSFVYMWWIGALSILMHAHVSLHVP